MPLPDPLLESVYDVGVSPYVYLMNMSGGTDIVRRSLAV